VIRLLSAALSISVVAGMVLASPARADDQVVQDLSWSPTTGVTAALADSKASGGKAAKLTNNTSATITGPEPMSVVKIRAKGLKCGPDWPNLRVTIDGGTPVDQPVATNTYTDFTYPASSPGPHTVAVAFTNEYTSTFLFSSCKRTLYVDSVTLTLDAAPTTPPPPPEPPAPGELGAGSQYVAMGDSYSSGWGSNRTPAGIDSSVTYGGGKCGQSSKGYVALITAARSLSLIDRACGGATIDDILTTSQYSGVTPQITSLTTSTKLVTFTIGGNDTGLLWMLQMCVKASNCYPGRNSIVDSLVSQLTKKTAALQGQIENLLRQIVGRAPNAIIRAAGYPFIIAPAGEPPGTCSAWLRPEEQVYFEGAMRAVNDAIRRGTETIAAESGKNIAYADPLAATSPFMARYGGQIGTSCSTDAGRWMNNTTEVTLTNGGWHPNVAGQQYYKAVFDATL
jgi:lysophospholipase L1-like esterase